MKFSKLFTSVLFFSALSFSCSSDDDGSGSGSGTNSETNTPSGNYLPFTLDSHWKYDVTTTNSENETPEMTIDNVYIINESDPNFTLEANDGALANGTINNLLTTGELTNNLTTLLLNGQFGLPELTGFIDPIDLDNFVIYNTEASTGSELSSISDTYTQDIEGYPVTINYTLKTIANGTMDSIELNDTTYTTVVSSKLVFTLSMSTSIELFPGFPPTELSILDEQEVLSNTYYFAEDIGLVDANGVFNYEINGAAVAAFGSDLPLPANGSGTNTEVLADYNIAE